MPLQRRLPKVGFINIFREAPEVINLQDLAAHFSANDEVTPEAMVQKGILRRRHTSVKVLAEGELKISLTVKAHGFSAKAKEKIEAAGGKAITL